MWTSLVARRDGEVDSDGMKFPRATDDIDWVFGYGSLIWNPEFEFRERRIARINGYHRAFCIESRNYRGTAEQPGVVLGLAPGGSVTGMAFHLPVETRSDSLARLYEREMLDHVYVPRMLLAVLDDGRQVHALTFVANRQSRHFMRLADHEVRRRLRECAGKRGHNREYAEKTVQALEEHGLSDRRLRQFVEALESA